MKLGDIRKLFSNKIKHWDSKLIEDMFKDFKTYYIYNTNTIEGNTLTLQQTNLLLNKQISPGDKDLREVYDHINARDVFDFVLEERPEITHETIIKIHSMLLDKIDQRIGGYRTRGVRVFGAEFLPSPPKYVQTDMDILLKWYRRFRKKLHPLVLSALFHEKFERIHPFYDGNGRTGRMLSNLILLREKYPPLIIEEKKRKQYYSALDKGHKADLEGFGQEYQEIVKFFYKEMLWTWEKIFSQWGL
jgi:Fic family protein